MKRRNFLAALAAVVPIMYPITAAASSNPKFLDRKCRWKFKPQSCPLVDIRWFGAVGDGVHDDTAAFAEASEIASHLKGGVVNIPAGVYLVKQVDFKSGVNYQGPRGLNDLSDLTFKIAEGHRIPAVIFE